MNAPLSSIITEELLTTRTLIESNAGQRVADVFFVAVVVDAVADVVADPVITGLVVSTPAIDPARPVCTVV
jgi:hypothetical protein